MLCSHLNPSSFFFLFNLHLLLPSLFSIAPLVINYTLHNRLDLIELARLSHIAIVVLYNVQVEKLRL